MDERFCHRRLAIMVPAAGEPQIVSSDAESSVPQRDQLLLDAYGPDIGPRMAHFMRPISRKGIRLLVNDDAQLSLDSQPNAAISRFLWRACPPDDPDLAYINPPLRGTVFICAGADSRGLSRDEAEEYLSWCDPYRN